MMESVIRPKTLNINRDSALQAIFYMILSAICFSVVELTGTQLVRDVSPYQLVWTRYAVHLLFMVVVLGPRYKTWLVSTSRLRLQITRSLTMLGMPLSFIIAVTAMPANDVWSVYWLSPLIAQEVVIPNADHTFTLLSGQHTLMNHIESWCMTFLPDGVLAG